MANPTHGDTRYVALTTYRRDGRPVTTPVWSVPLEGKIYVFTAKGTGKAKRIRATGRVRFAPSSMNGRAILGEWREGTGRVVDDEALRDRAMAALQRKYGWQLSVALLVYRLRGLHRDHVVLELTPSSGT
jgi:PPOX class probable F420-dependent enzyme